MKVHSSCQASIDDCKISGTFSIGRLYKQEKTKNIHIHDNYEIYYSISGGKQFLIDNKIYIFRPGDIFFINQQESHWITQIDNVTHERIVANIDPAFLTSRSSDATRLDHCFTNRDKKVGHRLSLSAEEQQQFLYFIHQLSAVQGYGQDILDTAKFLEMMVFLNRAYMKRCELEVTEEPEKNQPNQQIDDILTYINQNIEDELRLEKMAERFYISTSYLCRLFKQTTGTTVNRYINAKRIARAKVLMGEGYSVKDTYIKCGYQDYSNFFKAFKKTVGIAPRKYLQFSQKKGSGSGD